MTRALRWAPLLFAAVALALVPWTLWLGFALPSRHVVDRWDLAWAGFDMILAAGLLATAAPCTGAHRSGRIWRRSRLRSC